MHALEYAMANFKNAVAISVIANSSSEEAEETEKRLRTQWERLNSSVRLVVILSQYRSVARRLQRFVDLELNRYYDPEDVTVVVSQFITKMVAQIAAQQDEKYFDGMTGPKQICKVRGGAP